MGIHVEIECDYRTKTQLNGGCWSLRNVNPTGANLSGVKKSAVVQGWKQLRKDEWCCPACLEFIS